MLRSKRLPTIRIVVLVEWCRVVQTEALPFAKCPVLNISRERGKVDSAECMPHPPCPVRLQSCVSEPNLQRVYSTANTPTSGSSKIM